MAKTADLHAHLLCKFNNSLLVLFGPLCEILFGTVPPWNSSWFSSVFLNRLVKRIGQTLSFLPYLLKTISFYLCFSFYFMKNCFQNMFPSILPITHFAPFPIHCTPLSACRISPRKAKQPAEAGRLKVILMNGASGDDPETSFFHRTNARVKSVFYNKDVVCYTEKKIRRQTIDRTVTGLQNDSGE